MERTTTTAGDAAPAAPTRRMRALAPAALDRLAAAVTAARVDIAIVASITFVAAALRLWHIGTVPLGLHGDEAWTGIDARRVLREGWIGPYLLSAVGQPIGPVYWTAAVFQFFPETTTTVRVSMAAFGIATVPLAYCCFATMFNRTTAAFAALMLTVMMWHLHLSRLGFMVTTWPFMEMAILLALWHAMRRRDIPLFALAGVLTGFGVYTYNAYLLFIPVPLVAMLWTYAPRTRWRAVRWRALGFGAVFVLAGVAASVPMLQYVRDHGYTYRFHQRQISVTNSRPWKDAGFGGRADIIWDRAKELERGLVRGDRPDLGDGLATRGAPPVDAVTFVLALAGLGVALWNWKQPRYAVVLAALLILPWGALLTTGDGLFRRTFGLAPFVALLAAIPLARVWDGVASRRGDPRRIGYFGLVLLVPLYVGVTTARQYFGPVQDSAATAFVYPYQLDAASRYMDSLPAGAYVEFYSSRWGFGYETRRFLAPDVRGEDRSIEFRSAAVAAPADPLDLSVGAAAGDRDVAFVFLDPYLGDLDQVVARYPGGAITEAARNGQTLFRAYYLPRAR